jgi:hypothetical protein
VEIVGDGYIVASGLPYPNGMQVQMGDGWAGVHSTSQHAAEISNMAICLMKEVDRFQVSHMRNYKMQMRMGIHSGEWSSELPTTVCSVVQCAVCSVVQCAVCSVVQCAVCSVVQAPVSVRWSAPRCRTSLCSATRCTSMLQCIALHCNALQCIALHSTV